MTGERAILIVDDDKALCALLAEQFAVDGEFTGVEAGSVAEADAQLNGGASRFDAIILDVGLPDGDGRDYCAELRRRGVKVPIIMLTGSDEESDVVRGLDAGANDYVAKPFRLAELLARVRAQLRIFENSEDAVFSIGPYTFRPSAKLLHDEGRNKRIRLTEKEAAILKFLYRAGTRPVARQVLLNDVWGYNATVTTHTLETHIYRLRQKIETDPSNARLLVTEGGGYRLDLEGSTQAAA
ncbi:MAG TPA: response regulator transcription factor [Acidisphaera sp.]|nr:response regulator transcription factor [Acidisphaera sp.]